MKGEGATRGWEAGLIASGLSLLLEALGRNNPLIGLYGALTHFLGTPEAFNLLHRLLGYGEAAKALAGILGRRLVRFGEVEHLDALPG